LALQRASPALFAFPGLGAFGLLSIYRVIIGNCSACSGHCEERSDEAISGGVGDGFVANNAPRRDMG
jgi:hypothetical protein